VISRQVAALSAAVFGLVTVAGCSSSSSPAGAAASGSAAATSAASAAAAGSSDNAGGSNVGLTEKQLSAKVQAAMAQATAVRVKGKMVSGSDSVTLDLQLNDKDASSSGTISVGGMTVPIISTGGVIYFQLTDSLIEAQGGGSVPATVKGKWVSSKSAIGQDLDQSFGSFGSYKGFVSGLTGSDGLLNGVSPQGTATLGGQAVAVYKAADDSILDVAASGPAYVLEARSTKSGNSGALDFTWNQPTTVTAPPAADIYNG
jgi:hypothetical protein